MEFLSPENKNGEHVSNYDGDYLEYKDNDEHNGGCL
jgi:hypothetical protein